MKTITHKIQLALLTALGVGMSGLWSAPATAATFSSRPISQSEVVAVASPVGGTSHQLLILEQLSSQRDCWRDEGTTIDPLLLDFDFTDICGRGTDSNGYSVRVGGEDLGWRYGLRIERSGNSLRLIAYSTSERNAPELEIGTAQFEAGEMMEITLNPGWSITKRVYNGQTLGHYYLTNTQPLNTLLASASPSQNPVMTVQPTSQPRIPRPPRPSAHQTRPNPTVNNPATPSNQDSRLGLNYRVVVPGTSTDIQRRVRVVVPDAFSTRVDGENVMQAGVFREYVEAAVMRQRLRTYGLQAQILDIASGGNGSPNSGQGGNPVADRPSPRPPATPPRQPSTPGSLPTVPNNRFVVVIDPGHGGRDPGAIGIGGIRETDVVMDISRQVASLLQRQGVQVVMTRTGERYVDLAPRVSIAERADADIFVSIHANAISLSRPEVNGAETYYYSSSAGARLARSIQQSMLQRTGIGDRGVKEARFYVLRNTSMPSALVETGFLTGSQDAPRLNNPAFRTQMAEAIAAGILNYLQ